MSFWKAILDPIVNIIKEPLVEWQKRKTLEVAQVDKQLEREHEMRIKKADIALKLAEQGQQIEANWDTNAQNQMKTSLKDEWFVLLFSLPLIGAFIPNLADDVLKGFEVLSKTPDWYMWLVIGIVSATFGLRWMFGKFNFKK